MSVFILGNMIIIYKYDVFVLIYNLIFRHPIIKKLYKLKTTDPELAELVTNQVSLSLFFLDVCILSTIFFQLFANSIVGAGLIDDPRILLTSINELLTKALDKH